MTRPTIYYIRHGETDWNVEGRLQGHQDIPLNARGRAQSAQCGKLLRELFAQRGRDPAALDYVSSPLTRATTTMELARAGLGLTPQGYRVDPRLIEVSFGDWEGFTIPELRARDPQGVAARERDKWHFVAPGGESYKAMAERMHGWYLSVTRDTVVAAHGGTARGLMAMLGIAEPAVAPLFDIGQGIVYVFEGEKLTRYV